MSKRLHMLDKLIREGSRDPFHHYARALELRGMGEEREALSALMGLIESQADYVPSYLMAAQLAQQLGERERATELASQGLSAARAAGNDHAQSELQSFYDELVDDD